MAVNVTQKDKTLNDVIEWCREQVSGIEKKIPTASDADSLNGERCALLAVAAYGERCALLAVATYCESRLGHSGSMPSETTKPER